MEMLTADSVMEEFLQFALKTSHLDAVFRSKGVHLCDFDEYQQLTAIRIASIGRTHKLDMRNIRAYVRSVACNVVLEESRKMRRRREIYYEEHLDAMSCVSADDSTEIADLAAYLRNALDEQDKLLMSMLTEGLSTIKIGIRLGIPKGAVLQRKSRLRRRVLFLIQSTED